MNEIYRDNLREKAYDEVMKLRTQEFLHFRLEKYQLSLNEVIIFYEENNKEAISILSQVSK